MSSEMREVDQLGFALQRLLTPKQWEQEAITDRLNAIRALLARTEAGADGAEPFGWWIECHGTDGDFGQFVTDRAFVELLRSHGVVERETALFTHPQDASGDAERYRVLRRALADPMFTSDALADAISGRNAKAIDAVVDAMQAKEAK